MGIKVNQYDIDFNKLATYNSYAEAANILGVNESTIRKGSKFGRLVCGKFFFLDDDVAEEARITTTKGVKFKLDNKEVQLNSLYEIVPGIKFDTEPIEIKEIPAKILILDIETAPLRSYTWGLWKQNIGLNQIISNWYMLSWAAKWLGDSTTESDVLTAKEALEEEDYRIVKNLWKLLDEADIVIAHNGDKFDIPKINTRFVLHKLNPPSPYKQIDTLTTARKEFGFTSNRLDFIARFLGIGYKLPTTFELWEESMAGNEAALSDMCKYNRHDVDILEEVYLKLRPYIKGHPNLDLYGDYKNAHCPHCGKDSLTHIPNKFFYTQAVKYQVYRCAECGAVSRAKKGIKFENKKLISSIPR